MLVVSLSTPIYLVYAYDQKSEEKCQNAKELLKGLWRTDTGCLSIQVFQEFYVTVTQKIDTPLSIEEATEIITEL